MFIIDVSRSIVEYPSLSLHFSAWLLRGEVDATGFDGGINVCAAAGAVITSGTGAFAGGAAGTAGGARKGCSMGGAAAMAVSS